MDALAGHFETYIPFWEIAARFAIAAAAGFALGLEREIYDRSAGLRTHMLIALAAAVFTVVTIELAVGSAEMLGEAGRPDTLRITEAVTAGVAFLGAGAIIQSRGDVRGLTTAAGMWLAGATGVAAGGGFYGVAILAAVLGVIIIVLVRTLEAALLGTKESRRDKKDSESPDL